MLQMSVWHQSSAPMQYIHEGLRVHRSPVFRTSLQKMTYSLPVDRRSSAIRTTLTWMKMVSVFSYNYNNCHQCF